MVYYCIRSDQRDCVHQNQEKSFQLEVAFYNVVEHSIESTYDTKQENIDNDGNFNRVQGQILDILVHILSYKHIKYAAQENLNHVNAGAILLKLREN